MSGETEVSKVENGVWSCVDGTWQQVYGSFLQKGVSIEWHDFRISDELAWGRSFHECSLEICVNYGGCGCIGSGATAQVVNSGEVAAYIVGSEPLPAERTTVGTHRFLTFEFSAEFLARQLVGVMDGLRKEVRGFIDNPTAHSTLIEVHALASHLLILRQHMLQPPVSDSAFDLWYRGKCMELLTSIAFKAGRPGEFFCHRHQRMNRELCERILFLLERDMENPPSLEMLAAELGRSPFYLSRTFSSVTGQTIPAALRAIRMKRAALLLQETDKPITEVAFEVGYSSLGAFNKAFTERFGQPPSTFRQRSS